MQNGRGVSTVSYPRLKVKAPMQLLTSVLTTLHSFVGENVNIAVKTKEIFGLFCSIHMTRELLFYIILATSILLTLTASLPRWYLAKHTLLSQPDCLALTIPLPGCLSIQSSGGGYLTILTSATSLAETSFLLSLRFSTWVWGLIRHSQCNRIPTTFAVHHF